MQQNLHPNTEHHDGTGLYHPTVLDFIKVAAEYCRQVEQTGNDSRDIFIDAMLTLLPMLYLKATLLPEQPSAAGYNEQKVTEEDYEFVRTNVARIMGERDDYLDVFVEDFRYSDQPVLQTISENLADLYQELRELMENVRLGHEESMQVALNDTMEHFRLYWGQTALNALRALHDSKYGGITDNA